MHTRKLLILFLIAGIFIVSCSGKKSSVTITQYTDPLYVTGIAPLQDAVFCATKGGLVKWELPEGRYTVFTTADGLPSNILNDVLVDEKGLLWIASMDGVISFDGAYFKVYGVKEGLPSTEINDLTLDRNGDLWVATEAGAALFENDHFTLLDEKKSPGQMAIQCIFFDEGNNTWIGTKNNSIYSKIEGEWRIWKSEDGVTAPNIVTIAQAWDRSMWVGTPVAIIRWDRLGWQLYSSMDYFNYWKANFLATSDNRFWFFTMVGVHISQGSDWFHFTEKDGLISNNAMSGYVVSDEKAYIGTTDGLSIIEIEKGTIENYAVPEGINGHNCIYVTSDDRNRVWLGTWETGLNLYDSGHWSLMRTKNEKTLATVRSIAFGPGDKMGFNTKEGVVLKDGNKWDTFTRNEGISGNDVRCGVYDTQGNYWAGTAAGICKREKNSWKRYRPIHGLPSEDTWACEIDNNGTLWFGTTNGIVSFTDDVLTDRTPEIDIEKVDVRSMAKDGNRLLFGTNDSKLIELEDGSWNVYSSKYLGTERGIHAITVDPSGVLWIGTDGDGVIRIEKGKKVQYTVSDGLPSNYIRSLTYCDGAIWAACYGGVVSIELQPDEK
ncbi:MAG: hypothetical protein HOC71_12395 [Candidatus Latescibacteria bacterium]|nr:hypothetical protein [Candidatus Latescibacterota bacterium]